MLWIKRNLFLAVGGLVALALLGLGGYYFWASYQENKAVEAKLDESKAELKRLYGLVPFPSQENIAKARAELKKLQAAIGETQKSFSPLAYEKVKGQAFKTLLDTTIDELQKRADQASVALPSSKGFAFTFAEQQKRLQFSEGSFPTLAEQLAEIKTICRILFDAKINKLASLKRGRVTSDDPPAAPDYHELAPNRPLASGGSISPYIVEFDSFSLELAGVLEGFYKSPNGLLVKAVEVRPLEEKLDQPGVQPAVQPVNPIPAPLNLPTNRPPFRRNPLPGTTSPAPAPPPAPRVRPPASGPGIPPAGGGAGENLKTVLDEKMLRITLWIDVLKPPAK